VFYNSPHFSVKGKTFFVYYHNRFCCEIIVPPPAYTSHRRISPFAPAAAFRPASVSLQAAAKNETRRPRLHHFAAPIFA